MGTAGGMGGGMDSESNSRLGSVGQETGTGAEEDEE